MTQRRRIDESPDSPTHRARRWTSFLLHHTHDPVECSAAFASWRGFDSPLRGRSVASTCLLGGHALWWRVEAADQRHALALLPPFVARRTVAIGVRDVRIP